LQTDKAEFHSDALNESPTTAKEILLPILQRYQRLAISNLGWMKFGVIDHRGEGVSFPRERSNEKTNSSLQFLDKCASQRRRLIVPQ
jgi:hypothetical protein